MHKFKYFRIIKRTDVLERSEFVLQGANSWFDKLFGFWQEFTLKHSSYDSALQQLKDVRGHEIKIEIEMYWTT